MPDPYTDPDRQPESAIEAMATRLEERGRNGQFVRMIQDYADKLEKHRPLAVLDLGCGTGVVIRQLEQLLDPSSRLHGADISVELLKEAARLSPSDRIKWDHLSPGRLPYADASFDAITMHTLLSHVPEPVSILSEARRVLKNDGRLIVFDADHAGTTYSQPAYETTRRIDHLLTSAIATHPDICRQLPRYLKDAGFTLTGHNADVISEAGKGDYWLSSVNGFARLMPTIKALSDAEAKCWVDYMQSSHENGTFFAAGSFYTFYATPDREAS
ncbi:MAG: methyltransferase domain-containing protein [Verrucomicrobiota bacterium]